MEQQGKWTIIESAPEYIMIYVADEQKGSRKEPVIDFFSCDLYSLLRLPIDTRRYTWPNPIEVLEYEIK